MSDEPEYESKIFMKSVLVIDASFLDKSLIANAMPGYDLTTNFIPWNTATNLDKSAKRFNDQLLSKGVPRDTLCLLKMNNYD